MVVNILLGLMLLFFVFLFIGIPVSMIFESKIKESMFYKTKLEDRFEKEIQKVTKEEQKLYRKVFNKIEWSEPRFWDKGWQGVSTEINMGNLKIHARLNNDDKYTCWGITVVNNKKDFVIIYAPEKQQKLFNIFSEYAIWKWNAYQKELDEEKEKTLSKEHQESVKKANKFLK